MQIKENTIAWLLFVKTIRVYKLSPDTELCF